MTLGVGQTVLDRYVVDDIIGEGGMGRVFAAHHRRLGFPVVVKVMIDSENEEYVQRFIREAELMAAVRHPNVVAVHDYGLLPDGSLCIAMERVDGTPLNELLEVEGPLHWRKAVKIIIDVLVGLSAVHDAGVLHRDLKPANAIYVSGDSPTVKLIDFGIARSMTNDTWKLTKEGKAVGTPAYMAPETLLGEPLDARADLYSVGLLLYESISGDLPFANSPRPLLDRMSKPAPPPIPVATDTLPAALLDLLQRMLSVFPEGRPPTARSLVGEFRDLLAAPQAGHDSDARRIPVAPAAPTDDPAVQARLSTQIIAERERVREAFAQTKDADLPPQLPAGALVPIELPPAPPPQGFVVAVSLPPSVLSQSDQRRWLDGLLAYGGRGLVIGHHIWIAWGKDPDGAERLRASLSERFGTLARLTWRPVDSSFYVGARAAIGAAPLPEPLPTLIEELHGPD